MRHLTLLIFCLLAGSIAGCHTNGTHPETEALSETEIRLHEKADEALIFCRKNNYDTTYCILIDMKIHSGKHRMFVWNFQDKTISHEGLCCHGKGGGSTGGLPVFSNVNGSNCTSLGKYKIGDRSYSKWGIHIHYKLHGLEDTNNNAFKRYVVLHSFDYVPNYETHPFHLPMGMSEGCPVISNELMTILDAKLQKKEKPVLLWIYY